MYNELNILYNVHSTLYILHSTLYNLIIFEYDEVKNNHIIFHFTCKSFCTT